MLESQTGFVNVNGTRLWYEAAGEGHPFVMLHGHLLDSGQWDDEFTVFAQEYRVVRFDARGFGQSADMPTASYAHHEDLHGLMQALGIRHAFLMGSSGGGATAIDFALTYPDMADALILVGAAISGFRPSGQPPQALIAFQEALGRGEIARAVEYSLQAFTDGERRTPEQVNQAARERTRAMTAKLFSRRPVQAEQRTAEPPAIGRLHELHMPILALVGSEDNAMLHELADMLVAHAPNARKVVIADAGHHPNMEHPEEFERVVREFLGSLK
jgi:3-oxoadipate enol-lactonase